MPEKRHRKAAAVQPVPVSCWSTVVTKELKRRAVFGRLGGTPDLEVDCRVLGSEVDAPWCTDNFDLTTPEIGAMSCPKHALHSHANRLWSFISSSFCAIL